PALVLVAFTRSTSSTGIYAVALHDALPISREREAMKLSNERKAWTSKDTEFWRGVMQQREEAGRTELRIPTRRLRDVLAHIDAQDRKSTRLNSSHVKISYAAFCLKKKIPAR